MTQIIVGNKFQIQSTFKFHGKYSDLESIFTRFYLTSIGDQSVCLGQILQVNFKPLPFKRLCLNIPYLNESFNNAIFW